MAKIKTKSDTVVQSKTINKLLEAVNKTLIKTNQLLTDDAKEKTKTKKTTANTSSTNSTKYKPGEVPLGVELADAVVQSKARKDVGNLLWSYALGMDPAFAQLLGLDRVGKVLGKAISPKIFDPFNKDSWKKRIKNTNKTEEDIVEGENKTDKKETYGSAVKKSNSLVAKFTDFFAWMKKDKNKKETKQEKEKEQDSLLKTLLKLGALGLLAGLIVKALSSSSILSNIKAFMDGALSKGLGLGAAGLAISDALPGALIGAKFGGVRGALIGGAISLGYNSINRSVKDFEKRSKAAENGEYLEPDNLPGGFTPNTFAGVLSGAIAGFMRGGIPGALAGAALGLAGGWIVNKVQQYQLEDKANAVAAGKALKKDAEDPLEVQARQYNELFGDKGKYISLAQENEKLLKYGKDNAVSLAYIGNYQKAADYRNTLIQQLKKNDSKWENFNFSNMSTHDIELWLKKHTDDIDLTKAKVGRRYDYLKRNLNKNYSDGDWGGDLFRWIGSGFSKDVASDRAIRRYTKMLGHVPSQGEIGILTAKEQMSSGIIKPNLNEADKAALTKYGVNLNDYTFYSTQSKLSTETANNTHELNLNTGKLEAVRSELDSLVNVLKTQITQSMSKDKLQNIVVVGGKSYGGMSPINNPSNIDNNSVEKEQAAQGVKVE